MSGGCRSPRICSRCVADRRSSSASERMCKEFCEVWLPAGERGREGGGEGERKEERERE